MYPNPNPYGQPQNIGFTNQQTPYPMNQPPYPSSAAPGLPPTASGYSQPYPPAPQVPGYNQAPSYPTAYPPQQGFGSQPQQYPSAQYPPSQPQQYPPSQPQQYPSAYPQQGFPSQPQGYPPSQPQSYPPSQPQQGYPPSQPQQGYSPQAPGYPASNPYPAQQLSSGYPAPAATNYPPSPNFQQQGGNQGQAYPVQPQHITSSQAYSSSAAPTGPKMQSYTERPTLVPANPFDPVSDCQVLRKAMKGFGTDEAAIVNVLCKRSNTQRLQLIQTYKTSFGKDLIKDLKSELGGRFEDVIVALMLPRHDYIATTIHKSISGIGTKEKALVDCLCTATNDEIRAVSASYTRLFGRTLEKDIMGDTSGCFARLLVSISAAGRMENQPADPSMVANDVRALHEAGAKKIGTDEAVFNQILCLRSFEHLRLVFHEYERAHGVQFEKVIEREFSGDIESGLKAVVACAKSRASYFAKRLKDSFQGAGTNDEVLIFIIVTRCEIDLQNIKDDYQRNYNKSLASAITSETSGDYKKALLALCGN